jgi:hypothetical protein
MERAESDGGWISQNNWLRLSSLLIMVGGLVKIAMATLLSLFVPQRCDEPGGGFHVCSLEENLTELTAFNTFCVVLNFFTLVVFLATFALDIYREFYVISNFDHSDDLPATNLKEELDDPKFERIAKEYKDISIAYFAMYASTYALVVINAACSAVLVFVYYFLDAERTALIFISYLLLVIGRVHSNTMLAYRCFSDNSAQSSALTIQIAFNTMDAKYKKKPAAHPPHASGAVAAQTA